MITHGDLVWSYLAKEQQILVDDGLFLIADSLVHKDQEPTDYSYLVFPFAKLYEGFLKDVLLQLGIITQYDYTSNRFRIGKVLNPAIATQLRDKSAFSQLRNRYRGDVAERLWEAWKQGRNLVFHYFPGNIRLLTRVQAISVIELLTGAMEELLQETHLVRILS